MQKQGFLVLFILAVMWIHPVHAQRFKVGLSGGVNITDVDGMDPIDADNDFKKFGFTAGGFVSTHIGDKTIIQMEIAYSQKGSHIPPDTLHTNAYYTLRLDYVEVNLLFRHTIHLNLSKKPTDKFALEGGLSAGYMFHYYFTVQSIYYPLSLNTTDASAFVGFSYNFTPGFCIDLRYYNSFTPLIPHNTTNTQFLYHNSWTLDHNLCFQITFKYTFGAGGSPPGTNSTIPPAENHGS